MITSLDATFRSGNRWNSASAVSQYESINGHSSEHKNKYIDVPPDASITAPDPSPADDVRDPSSLRAPPSYPLPLAPPQSFTVTVPCLVIARIPRDVRFSMIS